MALTHSNMMALGTTAPDFSLLDVITNKTKSLTDIKSNVATVIMFICNHCPYVKHIEDEIAHVSNDYLSKGVSFVAISANDANAYPEDAPEKLKQQTQRIGFHFPYLYDETQKVAKAYKAACTPDIYVFDKDLKCVYRGRFDESTPGNEKMTNGNILRSVLDDIIAEKPISVEQIPSMGCSIKWKS